MARQKLNFIKWNILGVGISNWFVAGNVFRGWCEAFICDFIFVVKYYCRAAYAKVDIT